MTLGVTATIHLTIERGSDFYVPIQVEASLPAALSVADISGWTFTMTIRDTDTVGSSINQSINGTIIDAPTNKAQFFITDTVNDALPVGNYLHDMWRVDADKEFCLAKGNYVVTTNRRVPN